MTLVKAFGGREEQPALLDVPRPAAAPGSVRVRAEELTRALTRLARLADARHTRETCRYLWLHATDGALVGTATGLASIGQADMMLLAGHALPLVGVHAQDVTKLTAALRKQVTVTVATDADQLTVDAGGETLAKVLLRVPTPADTALLSDCGAVLRRAHDGCASASLQHGWAPVPVDAEQAFYDRPGAHARRWYTADGHYLEIDDHFRGVARAPRVQPQPAARTPRRQPLPVTHDTKDGSR